MADLMRDTILAMEAGPELNALVKARFTIRHRYPSIDIAAAMEVVETVDEKWIFDFRRNRVAGKVQIEVSFWRWKRGKLSESYESVAPTAPLAICRAALLTTLEVKATSDV